ncbi:MAG: hypothetical protein ACEQR8_01190 [Cypionkella sp.]
MLLALAALAIAAPAVAAPGDINAHAFYTKAVALKKKGVMALMSGQLKPMMAQMEDAGKRVRAQNLAATQAGKALYCPPAQRKSAGAQFVIDKLAAIPENRRRQLTLTEAWREIMIGEFPCR